MLWQLKEIIYLNDVLEKSNEGLNCLISTSIFTIEKHIICKIAGTKKPFSKKP